MGFFVCLLIKELLHRSSHDKNSNNASASHSRAIVHRWWRPNGIRERPPERSVTKIDPMWVWFVLKPQYQKCEPREALGLTYWLIHVVLSAGESVMFPPESWQQAHTPPAKLAAWLSLGSRQSSNQTHPVFTKCVIMSLCHTHTQKKHNTSSRLQKHVWTSVDCIY